MEEEDKIRVFIAIEPAPRIRDVIRDLQNDLKRDDIGSKVRWVKPEGIHLTLKFLGDTPSSQIEEIGSAMSRAVVGHKAFTIACAGMGLFPESGNPRVIWVGITEGIDALSRLSHDLDTQLSELGFPSENRAFKAHLTLGRIKSRLDRGSLVDLIKRLKTPTMEMDAQEIILFHSDLQPQGSIYTPLKRVTLTPLT